MFENIKQSRRSRKPPCPGIVFAKSFILYALFIPEARNPANGDINDTNTANNKQAIKAGDILIPKTSCISNTFISISLQCIGSKGNVLNL